MMNKEVYLKNVAESLALLSREVSILNAVNLYDINIVAEDFFPGLLNLIYGYELKNANYCIVSLTFSISVTSIMR